jgi:hypothetical protein
MKMKLDLSEQDRFAETVGHASFMPIYAITRLFATAS